MGVKLRFIEERWAKSNGTAEKVKLEKPYWAVWIRDRFRKCVEEAGLPSTGDFHSARHSFASHLIGTGAPLTAVRDLMGNAELTTTNIYAHSVSDVREIVERLDNGGKSASPRKQESAVDEEVL